MNFPLSMWFPLLFLVHYALRSGLRTLVRLEEERIAAETADIVEGRCYASTGDYNAAGSVMGTMLDDKDVAQFVKWAPSENLQSNGAPCFYFKSRQMWEAKGTPMTVYSTEKIPSMIRPNYIKPTMLVHAHRGLHGIRMVIALFSIFYIVACLLGRSDEAVRSLRNSSASPKKHEVSASPPMPPLTTEDTAFSYPEDTKHLTRRHVPSGVETIPTGGESANGGRGGGV
jgi:hypothetical protein